MYFIVYIFEPVQLVSSPRYLSKSGHNSRISFWNGEVFLIALQSYNCFMFVCRQIRRTRMISI